MRWTPLLVLLLLGCAEEAPAAEPTAQEPVAAPDPVDVPAIEEVEPSDEPALDTTEASGAFLAARHQQGLGLRESDPAEAVSLFEQACDHGFTPSCLALADHLERGDGVEADLDRAHGLLEMACHDGSTIACDQLGH